MKIGNEKYFTEFLLIKNSSKNCGALAGREKERKKNVIGSNKPMLNIASFRRIGEMDGKGKLNWMQKKNKSMKIEKKTGKTVSALALSVLFFWLANRTKNSIRTQLFLPWACTAVQPNRQSSTNISWKVKSSSKTS